MDSCLRYARLRSLLYCCDVFTSYCYCPAQHLAIWIHVHIDKFYIHVRNTNLLLVVLTYLDTKGTLTVNFTFDFVLEGKMDLKES